MSHLPAYKKTITAVVGAVLTWATVVVTSEPTSITASEWLLAAGSLATALGVFGISNEPSPNDPEAGQGTIDLVIKVLLIVILISFAWLLLRHTGAV